MPLIQICLFILSFLFLCARYAGAQDNTWQAAIDAMKAQMETMQQQINALQDTVKSQEEKINAQEETKRVYEERIQNLQDQLARQASVPVDPATAKGARPQWLPEIGVIADTVYTSTSTKEDEEGANRLSLRELELVLGGDIDPYSRLDATIAFSDEEEPSLEEAYMTRFGLPFDTTARLGKFKPKVGKALAIHRDSLDTVDEPLVIQRYFGVEGLNKSGLDFTTTFDFPWPVIQQFSFGVLEGGNGENGTAFGTARRTPTVYSHLKNYVDLNATTGFELGLSHMAGAKAEEPNFEVQVLAADVTLTKQLGDQRSVKLQAEAFNLNRKKSYLDIVQDDDSVIRYDVDGNLWGAYGVLDVRFAPQWAVGGRYDYVQLVDNPLENPKDTDRGSSAYLTFYQSEFARWRLQYSHKELATGKEDNTVFLQGTFSIGEHKHKLQ